LFTPNVLFVFAGSTGTAHGLFLPGKLFKTHASI
jgi:hypothetical protein